MKLVHGKAIHTALREIMPTNIAVAYVGIDWKVYVNAAGIESIVLSPTLGSNPSAIREIAEKIG